MNASIVPIGVVCITPIIPKHTSLCILLSLSLALPSESPATKLEMHRWRMVKW